MYKTSLTLLSDENFINSATCFPWKSWENSLTVTLDIPMCGGSMPLNGTHGSNEQCSSSYDK